MKLFTRKQKHSHLLTHSPLCDLIVHTLLAPDDLRFPLWTSLSHKHLQTYCLRISTLTHHLKATCCSLFAPYNSTNICTHTLSLTHTHALLVLAPRGPLWTFLFLIWGPVNSPPQAPYGTCKRAQQEHRPYGHGMSLTHSVRADITRRHTQRFFSHCLSRCFLASHSARTVNKITWLCQHISVCRVSGNSCSSLNCVFCLLGCKICIFITLYYYIETVVKAQVSLILILYHHHCPF